MFLPSAAALPLRLARLSAKRRFRLFVWTLREIESVPSKARNRSVTVGTAEKLIIALFQTCAARVNILRALSDSDRYFTDSYSSANFAGMTGIVEAGLAVAGLALCSVPPSLTIIGETEGLPPIADLEIGLLVGRTGSTAAQRLREAIEHSLGMA